MTTRSTVTAKQWEDIKPKFLYLYHDENKSLAEVRQQLEAKYGFKASRSAFYRQIEKWDAYKNYKESDKQHLALQQSSGQRPKVDGSGRPIKWDRVYRTTRSQRIRARNQNRPPLPLVDCKTRAVGLAANIWRQSTHQFASKDPSTKSYHMEYALYHRLMYSMGIISTSSESRWPKLEIDYVCNAIPALVREQPAMACEVLIFLTKQQSAEGFGNLKIMKDELFNYIRSMSCVVLPENNPLRQLLSSIDTKEAFTELGGMIAKAKLDAMWNTHVSLTGQAHHQRLFFRQVLINAILVVMEYGDVEYASAFLRKMSASDASLPADESSSSPSELSRRDSSSTTLE